MDETRERLRRDTEITKYAAAGHAEQRRRVQSFLWYLTWKAQMATNRRPDAERAFAAVCTARLCGLITEGTWTRFRRLLECYAGPESSSLRLDQESMILTAGRPQEFVKRLMLSALAFSQMGVRDRALSAIERAHAAVCVLHMCRAVTLTTANQLANRLSACLEILEKNSF